MNPFQSFPFPPLLGTLQSDAYRTGKRCIPNVYSKEEPRHFLIYHYITELVYGRVALVIIDHLTNKTLKVP